MAFVMRLDYHAQRQLRRERVFRDRSKPLDMYTDEELLVVLDFLATNYLPSSTKRKK